MCGHLLTRDTEAFSLRGWGPSTGSVKSSLETWAHDAARVAPGRAGHRWEAFSPESPVQRDLTAPCIILPPWVRQMLPAGRERAKLGVWMEAGWVHPTTVTPRVALPCCDAPGESNPGPSLQNVSFPLYPPNKQTDEKAVALLQLSPHRELCTFHTTFTGINSSLKQPCDCRWPLTVSGLSSTTTSSFCLTSLLWRQSI